MDELLHTVRREDRDRLWCAMMAKTPAQKEAAVTLFALEGEWRRIPSMVSEPMIGVMRLKWWETAIEEVFAGKTDHLQQPVLQALAALKKPDVVKTLLQDSAAGYEALMYEQPFKTLDDMELFVQTTTSSVHLALLHVLVDQPSPTLQKAVSHGGTAWGLWQCVRQLHRELPSGHMPLPLDVAERHQLLINQFGGDAFTASCAGVVREMMECALGHVAHMHDALGDVPQETQRLALPVLLVASMVKDYNYKLQKSDYDVLTKIPTPLSMWRLLKLKILGMRE